MTRTLFIGLDGASFTVLDDLVRDVPGRGIVMPFMKRLFEKGVRSCLRSTPNPLTPPAWTTIMTGRNPGGHGIHDFMVSEDKGGYLYYKLADASQIRCETIWSILSRQHKRVAALNFVVTAPPRPINGTLIPGFLPWKHLKRNILPIDLYDRLKREIPDFDPKELAWDFDHEKQSVAVLGDDAREQWVRYHLPRDEQWFRVAEHLLKSEQHDLFAIVFDGTDKIQHQAWEFLDPALLSANPGPWEMRMRDACLEYFRRLDGYIARLVELAGPDAQVFLASDHGFTASTQVVRINTFLAEKGYLHWKNSADERLDTSWMVNLDWEKTLAYCGTPSSNGIHIRVATDAGGPGVPLTEYSAFRARLIDDLLALRDADGLAVIRRALPREEVFHGPAMNDAPDLTLELSDYGFVSIRDVSPVIERRLAPVGTHHPDGILVAYGKGIANLGEQPSRQIVDVAPTLLASLGVAIPQDLEGKVENSWFTPEWLIANPVGIGPATLPVRDGEVQSEAIAEDDKAALMEQLRLLGYLE